MDTLVNNKTVKKTNRGQVFKKIVMSPGISRTELARELDLTKMSISNIATEFLNGGLIEEQEKIPLGLPHKNPIGLNISAKCPRIIGVQVQRAYVRAVLCDFRLNILDSREVLFEEISLEKLKQALKQSVSELMKAGNILGIGIGSIGPLDIPRGIILNPPSFGDIYDFSVVDFMEQSFDVPVVLEHHYNCAALAEQYFGMGQDSSNFFYLGITRGVGMGAVVNGRLYSSFLSNITEIGHVSINCHGRPCGCGNQGCLEQYVSTDVMVEELALLMGEKKTFREYCGMTDNPKVMQYLYTIMDYMKVALAGSVNLFRPELIIIGDEGKYLPDECIAYLEAEVNKSNLYQSWWHVRIRKTEMDKDLLLASAAMSVIERVFDGELIFD